MIESAAGPLLLRKSRSLPTQKCHAPPAVAESSRLIDIVNSHNSAISLENRLFSNSAKAENCDEYANKRYGSTLHRYSSRLGT